MLWEDFQCQTDYRQTSVRIYESMPYPRFTKIIIHHFLSKHKSISKRQGLFMNLIKDDAILGMLKFVRKGKDNQVNGMSILDVMVNNDIKTSKAYQTYLAISTRVVIPKKVRKGLKTLNTPKKKGSITTEENILSDPDEATELAISISKTEAEIADEERRLHENHARIVIGREQALGVDKEAVKCQKKEKMKGISKDVAAQELLNLKKGTRKSREDYIMQQIPKRLKTELECEVAKSENSDEEAMDEDEVHLDEELHVDNEAHDDEYVHDHVKNHDDADEEMNDEENADEVKDDQVVDDAEKVDYEKTEEEKEKPEVPPSSSSLSLSLNYGNQFLNLSSNTSLVGTAKEPAYTEINSLLDTTPTPHTTPLPTPPTLSEALTITTIVPDPLPTVLQRFADLERKFKSWTKKNPAFPAQSSFTPAQPAFRAVESLSEYELKQILFDKIDKSRFIDVNPDKVMRKRDSGDDQDPTAGSDQRKKKRRKGKYSEPSKDKIQTEEPLHEAEMDVEEPIQDVVVNVADQPQDDTDLKKVNYTWFKLPPRLKTPDPE
ncbi:hypothetical protein Tco_0298748 [Tanacetum coccineum]